MSYVRVTVGHPPTTVAISHDCSCNPLIIDYYDDKCCELRTNLILPAGRVRHVTKIKLVIVSRLFVV